MKKIFLFITALLITTIVFSQGAPQAFKYQGVARDIHGVAYANQNIGIKISIQDSNGLSFYEETHTGVSTNSKGIFTLQVGTGESSDVFSSIPWGEGSKFMEVSVKRIHFPIQWLVMGRVQLLSVPYTIYAKTAEELTGPISENDPIFNSHPAGNILSSDLINWDNKLEEEVDGSVSNEIQNLNEVLTENNSAGNKTISDLADPINASDAATKAYFDLVISNFLDEYGLNKTEDIDGNIYHFVKIGDQFWTVENLKTTKFNDGTDIPFVTDNTNWADLTTPAYCWYDNDELHKDDYGALYNWSVVDAGNLCPDGWHVPDQSDWHALISFLAEPKTAGNKLKETGTLHWLEPNDEATNETGFTALPGGMCENFFAGLRTAAFFWSATQTSTNYAVVYSLDYRSPFISEDSFNKVYGASVRCIKD